MLCFFVKCVWRVYAGAYICTKELLFVSICTVYVYVYMYHVQAVGASVRIFELLDRVSEIKDGEQKLETLKGGMVVKLKLMLKKYISK